MTGPVGFEAVGCKAVGFRAAFGAEVRRLGRNRFDLMLITVLPAVLLGLMAAMISPGSLSGLTVVVVDRDGGPIARAMVREVRASPRLALVGVTGDIGEALSMVRREDAVAVLVVPRGVGDGRPGTQPVEIFYEAQFLAAGTLASTFVEAAVGSALIEERAGAAGGGVAILRRALPGVHVSLLGNPTLSLEWYLGLLLGPGILHLSVAITAIGSAGMLIDGGSFATFARAAGSAGGVAAMLTGRMAPHVLAGTGWGIGWLLWLTLARGYRMEGSVWVVSGGLLLLFVATAAVGLLLLAITRNTATSLSGAVIVTGSALAYSGASLPINGAPLVARIWSAVLPLTHYLRLQMDSVIGAAARPLAVEAGVLMLYPLVAGGGAVVLIARAGRR